MNKYKVIVYAISKNEEKFVDRWYESMKEADEIYVLDTGSTDKTIEKLKNKGVHVKKKIIKPWRFDIARNKSLELVPLDADICVCTDLDEILLPGWRKELEKIWNKDSNKCKYIYNWSLDNDNNPLITFYYEKIHDRKNYKWIHPVHEVLSCSIDNENIVTTENIILNHYPDATKSRSTYLPLLELSVKEDPFNDRNMHYLGREYMYYKRYNECIDTLIKHLNLPNSTWKDERSASMRYISRSYKELNRYDEAKFWLNKAINETPYLREPYIEMALLNYELSEYNEVINNVLKALSIKKHPKTYTNEIFCWNETPYDLLSIAFYNIEQYELSLVCIDKALIYSKNDKRLLDNKKIILKKVLN